METRLIGMREVDINMLLLVGDRPLLSTTTIIIVDPAARSTQAVPQVETARRYSPNIKSFPADQENTLVPMEEMTAAIIEENDAPSDLLALTLTDLPSFVGVLLRGVWPIDCLLS